MTFPVEVPRGRLFFEVNKRGRVDASMSPICASPKFRPNSVAELLGNEIHTCNVHQGWCHGSVLQFPRVKLGNPSAACIFPQSNFNYEGSAEN